MYLQMFGTVSGSVPDDALDLEWEVARLSCDLLVSAKGREEPPASLLAVVGRRVVKTRTIGARNPVSNRRFSALSGRG